jgi:hypothetical protein
MLSVHHITRRPSGIVILACLALVCFVSMAPKANAEGGTQRVNVVMEFGYYWPSPAVKIKNTTKVYNAQDEWESTMNDSRLVLHDSHVGLELAAGEKLVSAFAGYGTIATPAFKDIHWNGKHPLPLYKYLKGPDGTTSKIRLSDISVDAYNPQLPLPEATKGTGVVSEPPGEMK